MTERSADGQITAAKGVVAALLREGTEIIFGIPGTQNLPLLDVLRETPEIRFILTRHEQGASFMAYGYARAAGRPGIVTATEGPGITNLVTAIAAAYKGYVPVISISGQMEEMIRDRDANQDIDSASMLRPITKWSYSIPSAAKAQEAVRRAFRTALAEPLGPVHIEASRDVLLEHTTLEDIAPSAYRTSALADCPPASIDEAMALLSQAERPLIVVGMGVLREGLTGAVAALAERSGIPVAALQYSPDAFPTKHPLSLGMLGRNGWGSANKAAPQADLILAVGAHIDYYSSTFKYGVFSKDAKLIHQSAVPTDIGVVFPASLAVAGSTRSFVEGLTSRVERAGQRWEWLDVNKLRADWDVERNAGAVPTQPMPGAFIAKTMRRVLPENGVMILDAGNAGKHVRPLYDTYEPHTFMTIDDWASVGGSFPIALGAKLARPQQPVMVTCGDMGMMCNIGELETAVRENIPVTCVVFNDDGLANERAYQKELYGGREFAVDYGHVDFCALARTFGAHGERVEQAADLEGALQRAIASGKPAVVDVAIDRHTLAPVIYRAEGQR